MLNYHSGKREKQEISETEGIFPYETFVKSISSMSFQERDLRLGGRGSEETGYRVAIETRAQPRRRDANHPPGGNSDRGQSLEGDPRESI